MRTTLIIAILIASVAAKAQSPLSPGFMNYIQRDAFGDNARPVFGKNNKNWSLSTYSAISSSFIFFNGGSANIISAPIGLQLNRKLTNNLYAFAGVSVAPAYVNFNHSFVSTPINKGYQTGLYNPNSLGIYSRAELGLQYVNDARTFSISGSIGVERSSYPLIPYQQATNPRPLHSTPSGK